MITIDYIFIFLYIAGMLVIGGIFSTRMKNSSEMFTAGRHSSWWMAGLSGFMTIFSAGTFVVWGGIAYRLGLVAVTILVTIGLSSIMVGFFIAGRWRQMGISTPAEYLGIRYGKTTVHLYTLLGFLGRGIGVGVALYSVSIMMVVLIPLPEGNLLRDPVTGNLSVTWAILIVGIITVIYTVAGGLWAVLMSDVVQSILLGLMVIIMVPFSLMKIGGLGSFISQAPEGFFLPVREGYSFLFMFLWFLSFLFQKGGDWPYIQRYICVPGSKDARKVAFLMGAMFIISPIIWMMPSMAYRVINPDVNPEQAYMLASQYLLPAGMLGMMVATMFSATASMMNSILNVFAGVFTRDIYWKLFNPGADEKHLVVVGRIVTLVFGIVTIIIALLVPHVGGAERVVITLVMLLLGPLTIPTIWGLFSKHIGEKVILVTLGITFTLSSLVRFGLLSEGVISSQWEGLASFASLIKDNIEITDGVLGLVVPVTILSGIELKLRSKSLNPGWLKIAQLVKVTREEALDVVIKASRLPNKILAWTFGILGLVVCWLALRTEEQKNLVIIFAVILLVISLGITLHNRLRRK
jgi:SSS family solute:Na+ symporter